ncbi:MAG: serine hydrolase, partial [Verrucomicrobiota bacterium]
MSVKPFFISASLVVSVSTWAIAQDASNGLAPEVTDLNAEDVSYELEQKLPYLKKPFINTSPADKKDGIAVGELGKDGGNAEQVLAFADSLAKAAEDPKSGHVDSLLISYQGKLLFESYYRRGRANYPHYQMSITKSYTAMAIGRAIQLGHLSMDDLHKPVITFFDELDKSKLAKGVETITLHEAMYMFSGIRLSKERVAELKNQNVDFSGVGQLKAYLENTEPIAPADQREFKYQSADTVIAMQILEKVVPGSAEDFIREELWKPMGVRNYHWQPDLSGFPKAAAGSSFRSRDMLKMGHLVVNEGRWNGKQHIPAEFVKVATSALRETYGGTAYGHFWWSSDYEVQGKTYHSIQGRGAGGQFIFMFPEIDLVAVVTSHNKGMGTMLKQLPEKLIPAFVGEQTTAATKKAEQGKVLFLLSGQSNMQGLDHRQTFVPRVEKEFGKENVVVVKEAIGGRPIRMWVHDWKAAADWKVDPNIPNTKPPVPEENGIIYNDLMAQAEEAMAGETPRAVAFCWMQGERDSRERHSAVYERSLRKLFEQVQAEYPEVPMVFVIGRLSDFGKGNKEEFYPEWDEIR